MKNRFPVVLLGCAVLAAAGIGLVLTGRSRPMTPEEATRECRRQVAAATPETLASCIRSKLYPRPRPGSRLVLMIPLGLGGTAVAVLFVVSRRGKTGMACPMCGSETALGDDDCVRCRYPLRSPDEAHRASEEPTSRGATSGPRPHDGAPRGPAGLLGPSDADLRSPPTPPS